MAFFDDDPPTQQRRSSGPPPPPRPPRGPGPSPEDVRRNQIVAVVVLVVVVLVLGVLLKSCVASGRVNGLREYNDAVNALATDSGDNVSQAVAVLLNASGASAMEQGGRLGDLATDGDRLTARARKLKTPGELTAATGNMATALSMRASAIRRIGQLIGKARGTSLSEQEAATSGIAGQMTVLLAADALWQTRVSPFIKDRFVDLDRQDSVDNVDPSLTLRDASWLSVATVAQRIGGVAPEDAAQDTNEPPTPGTHGHAVVGVSINGTELSATGVTNVSSPSGTSIVVTIENQGENDEEGVTVAVSGRTQAGGRVLFNQSKKVTLSAAGSRSPVTVNVAQRVTGSVTINAEVRPVNGEEKVENNKATYKVIFGS